MDPVTAREPVPPTILSNEKEGICGNELVLINLAYLFASIRIKLGEFSLKKECVCGRWTSNWCVLMSLDFDSIVRIILEIELIVGYGCWAYVARVREGREGAKFTLRIFWSTPAPTLSTSPEMDRQKIHIPYFLVHSRANSEYFS